MRRKKTGVMTLQEFETFFNNEPRFANRNEKTKDIIRDILVFGKTQRETATDNQVTLGYVNRIMQPVYSAIRRRSVPEGYVLLENVVVPASEAENILKLVKATKTTIKAEQRGGVT